MDSLGRIALRINSWHFDNSLVDFGGLLSPAETTLCIDKADIFVKASIRTVNFTKLGNINVKAYPLRDSYGVTTYIERIK